VEETENLAQWLSSLPDEEVVDFRAIKFEVYKVMKLGEEPHHARLILGCTQGHQEVATYSLGTKVTRKVFIPMKMVTQSFIITNS
jgi:hypothetical protein